MKKKINILLEGGRLKIDEINGLLPCEIKNDEEHSIDKPLNETLNISLTKRELEIVSLIMNGHTSKEISQQIGISYETVKSHRKNIFQKLNISSVSELIHLINLKYGQEGLD